MKLEHMKHEWNASTGEYTISLDLGNQHSLCDFPQHASLIEIADILQRWSTKIRQLAIVEELV